MDQATQAKWYIRVNGVEEGPMTFQTLRSLAEAGRISPDTPIRKEGMTKAVPAGKIQGFLTNANQAPVNVSQKGEDDRSSKGDVPTENSATWSPNAASKSEIKRRNWVRIVTVSLALLVLVRGLPDFAKSSYQRGAGAAYRHLYRTDFPDQQAKDMAKRNGVIYAVLMISGTFFPLTGCLILFLIIITTPLSQAVNKKLFALFPAFLIWGTAFFGFAQPRVHMMNSITVADGLLGSSVIWIVLGVIIGVLMFVGLYIRKLLAKRKYAP